MNGKEFYEAVNAHKTYGHFVSCIMFALEQQRSIFFIRNVCRFVGCEETIPHAWEEIVFKKAPAMQCQICGFIWQSHMRRPRVTCEEIIEQSSQTHTL